MSHKISMPHRHTVIYNDSLSEIVFEVEIVSGGIVLYTNSPRFLMGDENNLVTIIKKVEDWLVNEFSNVTLDDSPPPYFDL